jgi:hypothetical protein
MFKKRLFNAITLIIGVMLVFSFAACDNGTDNGLTKGKTPEEMTTAERWGSDLYSAPDNTATIENEIDDEGVCTVTVGGTAMTDGDAWDNIWKAAVGYKYTAEAGKKYTYWFEAWTEDDDRALNIQWYTDNDTSTYHNTGYDDGEPVFKITSERKIYKITASEPIPKSGVQDLWFHCANQTGTFYVKILLITADGSIPDNVSPEDLPTVADRWTSWYDSSTTVTIAHSVSDDDVCTITVGGTALTTLPAWDHIWKAGAVYGYTAEAGKIYTYSFEAWTGGADRKLTVEWYTDNDTETYHNTGYDSDHDSDDFGNPVFKITSTRQTYTITDTKSIPKSGIQWMRFQCANQTGTFHVKILEITGQNVGTLTITNFSGSSGFAQGDEVAGSAHVHGAETADDLDLSFCDDIWIDTEYGIVNNNKRIKGNTVTLDVWQTNYEDTTYARFSETVTVAAGDLWLYKYVWDTTEEEYIFTNYKNKVPITFTDGNATIDFGTQMEIAP